MKSTIKLNPSTRLTVQPCKTGGIILEISPAPTKTDAVTFHLTPDQAGALIFGLEQAAEADSIAQDRLLEVSPF
jgi:hypothetical protein